MVLITSPFREPKEAAAGKLPESYVNLMFVQIPDEAKISNSRFIILKKLIGISLFSENDKPANNDEKSNKNKSMSNFS